MADAVKNRKGPEPSSPASREIRRVAFLGFLLNLALAGMKGVLASATGSLAITASAVDSATDSISSFAAWAGLRLSERRTATFPMGLYKIENVISVVVALFIFVAGYELARQAVTADLEAPEVGISALAWLAAAVLATLLFGQYALHVGKRTGSPALRAEGRHRQVDVVSTAVVLASTTLTYFDLQFEILGLEIDRVAAFLVVLFVVHAGWGLLSDGMRVLLDASLEPETLEMIRGILRSDPLVTEVRNVVGRNAGRFRFVQADVALRTEDLHKAHEASKRLEARIREEVKNVIRVVIHYEPRKRDRVRIAVPLEDADGTLSPHFGEASHFALLEFGHPGAAFRKREVAPNETPEMERGKGLATAEWLVARGVDGLVLRADLKHKGPAYVFSNAGVRLRTVEGRTLDDVLPAAGRFASELAGEDG